MLRKIYLTLSLLVVSFLLGGFLMGSQLTAAPVDIVEIPAPGKGIVFFRIMVRAGSMHDPANKEGLAYFVGSMLKRGAGDLSRQDIERQLDQMGARLYTHTQKEFTMIIGACVKSSLPAFYEILKTVLLQPTFPASQVSITKTDQLNDINSLKNDNEDLGLEAFTHFVYAGTSWEHSAVGRVSAIKKFTRQDAVDFHKTYYGDSGYLTFGIAGDYNVELIGKIRADFGKLPRSKVERVAAPRPQLHGRKVLIVEKEGLDQGQINIGHPLDVGRKDDDFAPLYITSHHLGSHRSFTGLLMNTIRADRGLTYGAYSYVEYFPYPYHRGADMLPIPNIARSQQDWRIWSFTLAKNMDFALRLMLLKYQELLAKGIDSSRFNKVRAYAENKFAFLVETLERRLAMKLDDTIYGTSNFGETFGKRLAKTTLQQTNAAINKRLSFDHLAIVVTVPNAKQFKDELLAPGANVEYQGNIDPKPLAAEDAAAKALDLKLSDVDVTIKTADQLFE